MMKTHLLTCLPACLPPQGEQGYFKLAMGKGDMGLCGIASAASYPIKEHPNPQVGRRLVCIRQAC
jgi:hypothetical protein